MIGIVIFVFLIGAVLERIEKRGVFFVGEVVGGDMIGLQGNRMSQGAFPIAQRLTGDGEHEVDVNGIDSCFAEGVDGFGGLLGGVFAAEGFEDVWSERLDAERNAGDAEGFEQAGFFQVESRGVGFEGDFLNLGKIEVFSEGIKEIAQVSGREHGRRAAAEVEAGELMLR